MQRAAGKGLHRLVQQHPVRGGQGAPVKIGWGAEGSRTRAHCTNEFRRGRR